MNTMQNFQTDKTGGTFQKQMRGNLGRRCDYGKRSAEKEKQQGEKSSSVFDLYRHCFVVQNTAKGVMYKQSVKEEKQMILMENCSLQSCFHHRKKHKGALYVYVLIIMLMVTTLSLITALLFDGNLGNAATQRDNLQLYYYSKAGADWAVGLLQSSATDLATDSTSTKEESLADKLRSDNTYNVKWTGKGDLKAKGEVKGRFSVTVEKVKKRVNSAGQFVSTGGTEVDYAKITSVGKTLSEGTGGTLKEGKKQYVITVLVALNTVDNVIYMPGYDK